jgi:lycopene cyclase domain-containing protein
MPSFILSKLFILTILISLVPFFIVNYILTALPVVEYNPQAILGIKIFTIPLEDIFYSFTMISGWLMVYKWSEKSETKLVLIND